VWSHWHRATGLVQAPLASSMVCAVRVSRVLLRLVHDMARKHHRLLFCEMLFNTLAQQARLRVETPTQLSGILWRQPRYGPTFPYRPDTLYHPVKSLELQQQIRLRGYARSSWKDFAHRWIGEDSAAARDLALRWGEAEVKDVEGTTPSPAAAPLGAPQGAVSCGAKESDPGASTDLSTPSPSPRPRHLVMPRSSEAPSLCSPETSIRSAPTSETEPVPTTSPSPASSIQPHVVLAAATSRKKPSKPAVDPSRARAMAKLSAVLRAPPFESTAPPPPLPEQLRSAKLRLTLARLASHHQAPKQGARTNRW
jgi:hypothetical protein